MVYGRTVALVLLLAVAAPAFAQAAYSPPRTAEGYPDLQGVWISRWLTPLERQPGVATLALAPVTAVAAEKAEWARHNSIDAIEGTENFEFTHFVVVRGETRSSLIVDPANGRLPYTEQARARQIGARPAVGVDGPEQRALNERCLAGGNGFAPLLTAPSGNIRRIVQTSADVVIWTELLSQLRIIPVDGRVETGARREKTTGRWDGDTLVIETTGIIDPTRGTRGSLFPVTPKTRITERFIRTAPDELLYTFRVEDAALYTQPWTGETVMKRTDDVMYEFACHEGNYGLANILSGARETEARAAKAAKKGGP
jgi:hypothetical protein